MKKLSFRTLQLVAVFLCFSWLLTSCGKNAETEDAVTSTQTEQVKQSLEPQSIEKLITAYQQAHKNEPLDSVKMVTVFNKFMEIARANERFGDKKPSHIQPIYAYGIKGVAYHEIWFSNADKTVEGWVLLSATDKDYPVVNFSQGTPYSSNLVGKASTDGKIYRFGVSYYTLEQNGQKIAEHGQMPATVNNSASEKSEGGSGDSKDPSIGKDNGKIQPIEGVDFFPINSYDELKKIFPQYYFSEKRQRTALMMNNKFFAGSSLNMRNAYQYRYVSGDFGFYTQIPAYTSSNWTGCWSGCNNNAWANIYAWWDRNQAKGNLIPTTSTGETSPIYRNTLARRAVSDPVQMYCRSVADTYCNNGGGWTLWSNCGKGAQYAGSKGYGYTYYYQWCNSAGCNVNLANLVTDGIANNYRPVHIGANSHFYVGYGWSQWDTNTDWTWAYCYPGWSENHNDDVWVLWHDWNASVKMFIH